MGIPITRIYPRVTQESPIQSLQVILHNIRRMDHCQASHESVKTIAVLDPVYDKNTYGHSSSPYHFLQWHIWSYGWRSASFIYAEDSNGINTYSLPLSLRCRCSPLLYWSYLYNLYNRHLNTYPWSYLEVAIVFKVSLRNGYSSRGWDFLNYLIRLVIA